MCRYIEIKYRRKSIKSNLKVNHKGIHLNNFSAMILNYYQGGDSPSVLILRAVRTNANKVALNMTVPSLFSGMFMATRRCGTTDSSVSSSSRLAAIALTLETHLAGHSVRAELAEAQRRLDPPQQGHHIQVLYSAPSGHQRHGVNIIHPTSLITRSVFVCWGLTWPQGRTRTRSA